MFTRLKARIDCIWNGPRFCKHCGEACTPSWDRMDATRTSRICVNVRCPIGYALQDQELWGAVESARRFGGVVSDYVY